MPLSRKRGHFEQTTAQNPPQPNPNWSALGRRVKRAHMKDFGRGVCSFAQKLDVC